MYFVSQSDCMSSDIDCNRGAVQPSSLRGGPYPGSHLRIPTKARHSSVGSTVGSMVCRQCRTSEESLDPKPEVAQVYFKKAAL
jgi:hypothetical protein